VPSRSRRTASRSSARRRRSSIGWKGSTPTDPVTGKPYRVDENRIRSVVADELRDHPYETPEFYDWVLPE